MIFCLACVVSHLRVLAPLGSSIVVCFALFVATRGHFFTVVVWCIGALRTEYSHGLVMVGALGVLASSTPARSRWPRCVIVGVALITSYGRGCVWLWDGGGGGYSFHVGSSLPVLVSLYFPCQCTQWNGFQRFHCSVSNGLVAEVHIFVVGVVGRGYIDRQVSLSFF